MISRKAMKIGVIVVLSLLSLSYLIGYWLVLDSDAYKTSVTFLKEHPVVLAKVGDNVQTKLAFWGNSVSYKNGNGSSDLKIFLTGSRGKATAVVGLDARHSLWKVTHGILILENAETFDLM